MIFTVKVASQLKERDVKVKVEFMNKVLTGKRETSEQKSDAPRVPGLAGD